MKSRDTQVGTFEVCHSTHVALRMFIMQVLASQLHFLANRNADLFTNTLARQMHKIEGHVELPSNSSVHSLYCGITQLKQNTKLNNRQTTLMKRRFT